MNIPVWIMVILFTAAFIAGGLRERWKTNGKSRGRKGEAVNPISPEEIIRIVQRGLATNKLNIRPRNTRPD